MCQLLPNRPEAFCAPCVYISGSRSPPALERLAEDAAIRSGSAAGSGAQGSGFLFGGAPTLAEVYLLPQMANARRFGVDLAPYPRLVAADAAARALPEFERAAPEHQPDAPKT